MSKRLILAAVLSGVLASGCSEQASNNTMTTEVRQSTLEVTVPANGEVIAAKSTIMTVPAGARGPQTIAWLLAENSQVKSGGRDCQV